MRKIKLSMIMFIVLLVCGCADHVVEENSWNKYNLKGEVKSIVTNYYALDGGCSKLDIIVSENFDHNGMFTDSITKDSSNNVIDQVEMTYLDDNRFSKATFTDEKRHGCASVEVQYYEGGTRSESVSLDSKGQLLQKIISEYNKDGSKKKVTIYGINNSLKNINEFVYEEGILTTIVREDVINGHKTTYSITQDENGNIIKEFGIEKNGNEGFGFSREFDQHNNLLLEITDFQEQRLFYTRYEYEYDEYGNWITRIGYNEKSKDQIVERNIEYYSR